MMESCKFDYFAERSDEKLVWTASIVMFCGVVIVTVSVVCLAIGAVRGCVAAPDEPAPVPAVAEVRFERPLLPEVFPDPVCPWCGGVMDGQGCQCDGGGL